MKPESLAILRSVFKDLPTFILSCLPHRLKRERIGCVQRRERGMDRQDTRLHYVQDTRLHYVHVSNILITHNTDKGFGGGIEWVLNGIVCSV